MPTTSFETWCRAQLKLINGTDDVTLVYFLCSLTNQAEVTQYVQQYLGSNTAARKFAAEFIQKKSEMMQAPAQATVSTLPKDPTPVPVTNSGKQAGKKEKKKKKGKGLDASMLGFGVDASGRQL